MPTITTHSLGNGGRLGNQLFAYASLLGLADKYGHSLKLPEWKHSNCFKEPYPFGYVKTMYELKEPAFHYDAEAWECLKSIKNDAGLKGYFQSEKYWNHCQHKIKKALAFKPEFIEKVTEPLKDVFKKPVIAIHIRRGDYQGNENYHNLPIKHYILALFENFPDWEKHNLLIFSDDIQYCKVHFSCLDNAYFSEERADIEDICLMTQCDHFIIANSSYSWWGAYLGEKKGSKIIRPVYHFEGSLKETHDIKDYYPQSWIAFDYHNKRIDLRDATFTIPVYYDHPDRKQNLDISVCLLQHNFDCKIIVMENKTKCFSYMHQYVDYWQVDHSVFHRTKMLNQMAEMSETTIIVNWDADIILPPMQIWKAVQEVRRGADMVYPYDGRFARVPRMAWFKKLQQQLDIGIVGNTVFDGLREKDNHQSVGGSVFWNKKSYNEAGGENENFISFGAEDQERYLRAQVLNYKIERIKGPLYHIDHWVGVNSSTRNPYFYANKKEFERIQEMDKNQLKEYINTWNWK